MRKLIEFIRSIYVGLLFLALEALALHCYAHATCFTRARLLARSNRVAGAVHEALAGVGRYFSLGRENDELLQRVTSLETELARYREAETAATLAGYLADGTEKGPYEFRTARVISNSINKRENFIVLNRGEADGVRRDMAVLSPGGAMVGYVVDVSPRYAVAISVLNTGFRASGKLVGGEHFGAISWDGSDRYHVTMSEFSKYAEPQPGDEVVSTGFSNYFPAEVPIGTVEECEMNETRTAYTVRVRLAVDLSALEDVILVRWRDLDEVRALEEGHGDKTRQNRP